MTEHEHHEHHNHRESFEIPGAEAFMEAHMHDQAATVSVAICPNGGETFAFERLLAAMVEIAKRAEDIGGIVGHIKGFARDEKAFARASVTEAKASPDSEGDLAAAFGDDADIQLVSIVLLIDEEALIDICRNVLKA